MSNLVVEPKLIGTNPLVVVMVDDDDNATRSNATFPPSLLPIEVRCRFFGNLIVVGGVATCAAAIVAF